MHSLVPFTPHNDPMGIQGDIALKGRELKIEFRLTDPQRLTLDSLKPHTHEDLFRADGLWNTTCFEAFWGVPGEESYWELNLSGSQPKWNLYKFERCRQPSPPQESRDFEVTKLEATNKSLVCHLQSKLNLPALEANLCVIIRTTATTHYYSIKHAGKMPDYHLRESFILKLGKGSA